MMAVDYARVILTEKNRIKYLLPCKSESKHLLRRNSVHCQACSRAFHHQKEPRCFHPLFLASPSSRPDLRESTSSSSQPDSLIHLSQDENSMKAANRPEAGVAFPKALSVEEGPGVPVLHSQSL